MKSKSYDYNWEDIFEYSENVESGLIWKIPRFYKGVANYDRVGKMAGSISITTNKNKYWVVGFSGKIKGSFLLHKIIWILKNGKILEDYDIDHEDQNGLNNKMSNLRCVPKSINMKNKKLRSDNKTGFAGIQYITKKSEGYQAQFTSLSGKKFSKFFSVFKYGKEAKKLAIQWRNTKLKKHGYTEIHGKER